MLHALMTYHISFYIPSGPLHLNFRCRKQPASPQPLLSSFKVWLPAVQCHPTVSHLPVGGSRLAGQSLAARVCLWTLLCLPGTTSPAPQLVRQGAAGADSGCHALPLPSHSVLTSGAAPTADGLLCQVWWYIGHISGVGNLNSPLPRPVIHG